MSYVANKLYFNTYKGTLGEIIVQLKLLVENVQSSFPLKDSGNDLIAFIGESFKSIQVKTKQDSHGWSMPKKRTKYDILALVDLHNDLELDKCRVWLLTKQEAEENKTAIRNGKIDKKFIFSERRINEIKS